MRFIVHEPTTGTNKVWSVSGPDTVDGYTKIPKTIGQMKGDIIVFLGEGNPVRLPVGQDGQVLMADSTAPLGVRWVTLEEEDNGNE